MFPNGFSFSFYYIYTLRQLKMFKKGYTNLYVFFEILEI